MVRVGYIGEDSGIHYYYSMVEDRLTVQEYSGPEGIMKQKLIKLKCSAMILLFEQFLVIDVALIDPGKNVHTYQEQRKRCQAYVKWGLEKEDIMPESVIDNGFISRKYMKSMIKMISPENQKRKELIFLLNGVEKLYHEPYNI